VKAFVLSAVIVVSSILSAHAGTSSAAFNGSWNLIFVTRSGICDSTYEFGVNVTNGVVSHPNLVKFRGYVQKSGAVRASVAVQDKYASGSGRLAGSSGRGRWTGGVGNSRCAGYWTAQRN
jgi:hypothetical protein